MEAGMGVRCGRLSLLLQALGRCSCRLEGWVDNWLAKQHLQERCLRCRHAASCQCGQRCSSKPGVAAQQAATWRHAACNAASLCRFPSLHLFGFLEELPAGLEAAGLPKARVSSLLKMAGLKAAF